MPDTLGGRVAVRVHFLGPEDSGLREAVIALGDRHRKTLGHLPYEAFGDHADRGHIAVAVDEDRALLGYCLYALPRDVVKIVHLCVDEAARGRGVARALVDRLAADHGERTGMVLRCRRDYDAHTLWPKLGFEPLGEVEGRSRTGRKLTEWVRYLSPPPSLFDAGTDGDGLTAAIDTNIFLDLTERRPSADAEALRSPAVAARVQMVVTAAVAAELDRHPNEAARATSRADLLNFRVARTPADAIDRAEQGLRDGLGRGVSPAGIPDLRHLAAAIACGADVFITRDHDLRTRLARVAGRFGLEILTPAQLVTRIDEEHRHGVYRPADLAATDITRQRVTARDLDEVVQRFLDHGAGQTRSSFEQQVRSVMAAPARWEFVVVRAEDRPIALFACGIAPDVAGQIAVARCSNDVFGRTVLVHLLAEYRRRAASDPPTLLTVTDTVRPHVRASLEAEGLEGSAGRLSAVCGLGFHEPTHLAQNVVTAYGDGAEEAVARLAERIDAASDSRAVLAAERSVLPARLRDPAITTYLIPIMPAFAEALFDEDLAAGTLFPRKAGLGLSRENVYYRSPVGPHFRIPSRILWYVTGSRDGGSFGRKAVRTVSSLVSVHVGEPEQMHARFEHLAAYTLDQVLRVGRRVQALRFTSTEALRNPVSLEQLRCLAAEDGHTLLLRSAWQLPPSLADKILSTGV